MQVDWMSEARQIAGQCWCDPETENREMDVVLGEAFAKRLAFWMEIAAQNQRNCDYYRGLVVQCGEAIGKEAYIQDDGGISDDILCAKVPELVEALVTRNQPYTGRVQHQPCHGGKYEAKCNGRNGLVGI